jgi:hypothetical protein
MNMNRFAAITREEKEPVRTAPQNRRAHNLILPLFADPPSLIDLANGMPLSRGAGDQRADGSKRC